MSVLCSMVGASFTVAAAAQVLRAKKGITAVGNAQIDTAQSKFGGSSALFDGTGDYLQISGSSDFDLGTASTVWTVEGFIRYSSLPSGYVGIISCQQSGTANGWGFYVSNTGAGNVLAWGASATSFLLASTTVTANAWHHIAAVRNGSSFKIFLDGTEVYTTSGYTDRTDTDANLLIGNAFGAASTYSGDLFFTGWIDEVRISNTARYTANFTPSTTAFVNDANTLLLIHANGTDATTFFEDDNGTGRSQSGLYRENGPTISTTQSKFGGSSLYFPETSGQGIYAAYDTIAQGLTNTGDFTAELWAYFTKLPSSGDTGYMMFYSHNAEPYIMMQNGGVFLGAGGYPSFATTFTTNTWYHVAVTRSSGNLRCFVNGTQAGSTVTGSTYNYIPYTNNLITRFGKFSDDRGRWQGYMDEIRFSKTARYTANFTAPTTPFVNDADTLLLIHGDGTDASTVFRDDNGAVPFSTRTAKTITAVGNAQVDTAQFKYGSSSALFDGTGDAITIAHNGEMRFGTGDFTMEFWYRPNARTQTYPVVFSNKDGFSSGNIVFHDRHASNTTKLTVWIYNFNIGAPIFTATTTTVNGTWYHIALSRSGTSLKLFVNGTQEGSTYTTSADIDTGAGTTDYQLSSPGNSSEYNGHIDEVRVSNIARYTANFTPTGPFNSDPNTMLLMHMEGTDAATTFTDDVFGVRTPKGIQALGNAQIDTAQSKFGGASLLGDGTGDYLQIGTYGDLSLGANFTIECWYRIPGTVPAILPFYNSDHLVYLTTGAVSGGRYALFAAGDNRVISSDITISANTWYHMAMVRVGSTITFYHNGVSVASGGWSSIIGNTTPTIGSYSSYFLNGHIDEYRISNTARYTAGFTPSTTPFQNDANTLLLLHMDGTDGSTVFPDDNGIAPYTP